MSTKRSLPLPRTALRLADPFVGVHGYMKNPKTLQMNRRTMLQATAALPLIPNVSPDVSTIDQVISKRGVREIITIVSQVPFTSASIPGPIWVGSKGSGHQLSWREQCGRSPKQGDMFTAVLQGRGYDPIIGSSYRLVLARYVEKGQMEYLSEEYLQLIYAIYNTLDVFSIPTVAKPITVPFELTLTQRPGIFADLEMWRDNSGSVLRVPCTKSYQQLWSFLDNDFEGYQVLPLIHDALIEDGWVNTSTGSHKGFSGRVEISAFYWHPNPDVKMRTFYRYAKGAPPDVFSRGLVRGTSERNDTVHAPTAWIDGGPDSERLVYEKECVVLI